MHRKELLVASVAAFLTVLMVFSAVPFALAIHPSPDQFPRFDDIYFVISYPEDTAMTLARVGALDTMMGMIHPYNVEELLAGSAGTVLYPVGPAVSEWSPVGAAENWDCVDESVADFNTTYVNSTVLSGVGMNVTDFTQDAYEIDNTTLTGNILSVTVLGYAVSNVFRWWFELPPSLGCPGWAPDKIQFKVVVDGSDYYGPNEWPVYGHDDGWEVFSERWEVNPATNASWTWDDINNLVAGFRYVGVYKPASPYAYHPAYDLANKEWVNGTGEIKMTQFYVAIAYEKPGALPWQISQNPGFHMCYFGINCRNETPSTSGWMYDYHGRTAGMELYPLNDSNFRLALNYLFGCKKTAWIASQYEFINVRLDTCVPPANVKYFHTGLPPVPYDEDMAYHFLTDAPPNGMGMSNASGYWTYPNGTEMRQIYVMSPVEAPPSVATTEYAISLWNDFFGKMSDGTSDYFISDVIPFYPEILVTFYNRDHDIYFLCWGLGRDPDYLFDFFHPDADVFGGYNSPGLSDPSRPGYLGLNDILYAIKYWRWPNGTYILTDEEMVDIVKLAQEYLYVLVPYIPIYSRNYINMYNNTLAGWIESLGYGSNNDWSYGWLMNGDEVGGSVQWHCSGPIDTLLLPAAGSAYEFQVLGRIFEGGLTVDPFTHQDVYWLLTDYDFEPYVNATEGVEYGTHLTVEVRRNVYWQDGSVFDAYDVWFNWNYTDWIAPPGFATDIQRTFIRANIIDNRHAEVWINGTGLWIIYSYLGGIASFHPEIYFDNPSQNFTSWSQMETFEPWKTDYDTWMGTTGHPGLTCLIGTGGWIFVEWDEVAGVVHLTANRDWWAKNFIREDIDFNGKVEAKDIAYAIAAFGGTPGSPRWEYGRADVDWNNKVEGKDIAYVISRFGTKTLP